MFHTVACSCEEDCGSIIPCCFREDEERRIKGKFLPSQCTYTQVPQPNFTYRRERYILNPSYYMIGDANTTAPSCESVQIAPWGSLYPVTSISTGLIYKNERCAEAHNVTDIVHWKALVGCNKFEFDRLAIAIDQLGYWSDNCFVSFKFDRMDIDLNASLCYLNKLDECLTDDIYSPIETLSAHDIKKGCESGLLSPMPSNMLANPMCVLCMNQTTTNSTAVFEHECDISGTKLSDTSVHVLLDPSSLRKSTAGVKRPAKPACLEYRVNMNVSLVLYAVSVTE